MGQESKPPVSKPSASSRPLRLLIVEDTPADAELAVATLKRSGYALSFDVVDSREEFQKRLQQTDYDLILSDHNLVTWTGTDALEILQKSGKDIPLVVLTATLGDEAAVDYVKRGAADYILKHRLDRLPVAVGRVLQERAHREGASRLQEQILAGKREWELTFDTVPDPILVLDEECRIQRANRAAAEAFGLEFSQMLGKHCYEVVHGLSTEHPDCPHVLMRQTGREARRDIAEPRLNKIFQTTPTPLRDSSGRIRGCTHVMHDITDRKRSERALSESEARYRRLFESAKDGILILAADTGQVEDVNPFLMDLLGYSREEMLGKSVWDFGELKDVLASKSAFQKLQLQEYVRYEDLPLETRDGRRIDVEFVSNLYLVEDRKVVQCNIRDITDRKRSEAQLHLQSAALESAANAILITCRNGEITWVNPAFTRLTGYSLEETLGKNARLLRSGVHPPELYAQLWKTILAGNVWQGEMTNRRKDGSLYFEEMTVTPVRDARGEISHFIAIKQDVTARKRAEDEVLKLNSELEQRVRDRTRELEQANAELDRRRLDAERTNRFKDQFLSTMSHELRTPLNAVMGFSELLADERYGPLSKRQQRYVGHIRSGGQHLLHLINDVLDLSKIEAGRMELAIESVAVEPAVEEVVSELRPLANKKSLVLSAECAPDLAARADAMRFKQILVNLIGNAIKFTPEGGQVAVLARLENDAVRVEVRDTGPGIPPEEQKRIFEAFVRLQRPGAGPEGTGLGMAITQRLVEMHGGQLGLESELGKGSCFYISLPVAPGQPEARVQEPEVAHPPGGRVLVIEDDPVSARLIEVQLHSQGFEVTKCDEPDRAVAMATACQPQAITLDVLMNPTMGWEVLAQLKNNRHTRAIPVIMVTVVDQPAVGATLGAEEYLVKPVEKEHLLAAVRRCLRSRETASGRMDILVVEDDTPTREMIVEFLTAEKYSVVTAADGAAARAAVAAALPRLVILDLLLPEVSGFELLSEWRADRRTIDLPVFVLTSKDLSAEEEQYLQAHAKSLFRKQQPWQEALLEQLRRAVSPKDNPVA